MSVNNARVSVKDAGSRLDFYSSVLSVLTLVPLPNSFKGVCVTCPYHIPQTGYVFTTLCVRLYVCLLPGYLK